LRVRSKSTFKFHARNCFSRISLAASGGKDGSIKKLGIFAWFEVYGTVPVDRRAMDESILLLRQSVEEAKVGDREKLRSLQRLRWFVPATYTVDLGS
jgi:hypothetical protein